MIIDTHSHLVPGVDDGARDLEEALRGVDRLLGEGVDSILTTPHMDASLAQRADAFERHQQSVEAAWALLTCACRERHPQLALHFGREILIDVPNPDVADPRVRLDGGRYVLLEFPRLTIPAESGDALLRVAEQRYSPIVAHVERYWFEEGREMRILESWRRKGAMFQVNAGSFVGRYGSRARELAWELLRLGWVDLIASDYHARGGPGLRQARAALREQGAHEQVELLLGVNPRRILTGEDLEAVPALAARPSRWRRILDWWKPPVSATGRSPASSASTRSST